MLLDFCNENKVRYDICGKVIIAVTEKEIPVLENILDRGNKNGLKGLKRLTREEVKEIEPHVECVAGIFVPQTGIIDYSEVSEKYLELIKR